MDEFRKLVTENPEGIYQGLHNMTGIDSNGEVYLRDYNGEGSLSLVEYCRKECMEKCEFKFDASTPADEFGEYMDSDCPISILYHMAVGHAELRHRLGQYEDTGKSPRELIGLPEIQAVSNAPKPGTCSSVTYEECEKTSCQCYDCEKGGNDLCNLCPLRGCPRYPLVSANE